MRITHNILISNFLRNLNSISLRIERAQEQLTTGLKYNRPGDGPVQVGQMVGFKSSISKISQYLKNVDDGQSQVGYIDTILQSMIVDIGRSRELLIDGANDNLNINDRRAIAQEINLLIESTMSNANTRFRDRYIFAGWQTHSSPFVSSFNPRTGFIEDILYFGDRGIIDRLVGDYDQLTVNANGKDLFLEQTYTLAGKVLPTNKPLGFSGILTINDIDINITSDQTLKDIQINLEGIVDKTHVFASIVNSRLMLESAKAVGRFTLSDNTQNKLLEDFGLAISGAYNIATDAPTLPIIDSTPAIFTGAGPVANLTYDSTNNTLNIFLGADANNGVSKAANIFITPGTYASVADLITEIQTRIDSEYGAGKIIVSDAGGGVLQLETVATGDEIDPGDLVIGGPFNGFPDTASDSSDLNLVGVVGNAPATPAGTAGTDGNDKIIIDLGPTTSKNGEDVLPQIIDLRASMITNTEELLDELKYQIFNNDILRGAVEVKWYDNRLMFESVKKGEDILGSDFLVTEGATGTLAALNIEEIQTPAHYVGTVLDPIADFPFIVVAGFNDTFTVDLGPSVSTDGTNPDPVTVTVDAGIYNNITEIYIELNKKINWHPDLNGSVQVIIGTDAGPPVTEWLELVSIETGSNVRGEDIIVTGNLAGTLGWLSPTAIPGGGPTNGRGIEMEPSNIFSTLITIRDDLMGFVGLDSKLIDALNEDSDQFGLIEGDIITVTYDAGTFTFPVLSTNTIEDFINNIQEIFGTRANVTLTTDGRIMIENVETYQILDVSISAASPIGESRDVFNEIFKLFPNLIPGLAKISTDPMLDPRRYLRLGDEDLVLSDRDFENVLRHEAVVGARGNRLSNILTLFTEEDLNIRGLQTSIEAANYAEVLTLLSQQELVLQSALGVGARVLTPSLIGYLI